MNRFAYATVGQRGLVEYFRPSRTLQTFADEVVECITTPRHLDGQFVFSLVVRGALEGHWPEDVPQSWHLRGNYIQCAGSTRVMRAEIRMTQPDKGYVHHVVAPEPVVDAGEQTTLTWDNAIPPCMSVVSTQKKYSSENKPPECSATTSNETRCPQPTSYAPSTPKPINTILRVA